MPTLMANDRLRLPTDTSHSDESEGAFPFFVEGSRGCVSPGEWLRHFFPLLIPRRTKGMDLLKVLVKSSSRKGTSTSTLTTHREAQPTTSLPELSVVTWSGRQRSVGTVFPYLGVSDSDAWLRGMKQVNSTTRG